MESLDLGLLGPLACSVWETLADNMKELEEADVLRWIVSGFLLFLALCFVLVCLQCFESLLFAAVLEVNNEK